LIWPVETAAASAAAAWSDPVDRPAALTAECRPDLPGPADRASPGHATGMGCCAVALISLDQVDPASDTAVAPVGPYIDDPAAFAVPAATHVIARPRLFERLRLATRAAVTPGGRTGRLGKTLLVGSWVTADAADRAVAWGDPPLVRQRPPDLLGHGSGRRRDDRR
jgi:hypothetical protein